MKIWLVMDDVNSTQEPGAVYSAWTSEAAAQAEAQRLGAKEYEKYGKRFTQWCALDVDVDVSSDDQIN